MYKKILETLAFDNKSSILKDKTKERQTGLEPATPTLARSYSTNWATVAYKQMTGIEPASSAWEADILPMNYICERLDYTINTKKFQP